MKNKEDTKRHARTHAHIPWNSVQVPKSARRAHFGDSSISRWRLVTADPEWRCNKLPAAALRTICVSRQRAIFQRVLHYIRDGRDRIVFFSDVFLERSEICFWVEIYVIRHLIKVPSHLALGRLSYLNLIYVQCAALRSVFPQKYRVHLHSFQKLKAWDTNSLV